MTLASYRKAAACGLFALPLSVAALADGTEELGTPSIPVADGTHVLTDGVGLMNGPGTILLDPTSSTAAFTVQQAVLYWEGFDESETGQGPTDDITINVNGGGDMLVTGTRIGGPTKFFTSPVDGWSSTYRYELPAGLIQPGFNTVAVSGLDFSFRNNGAGLSVIYDDGLNTATIQRRDGNDCNFFGFAPPLNETEPQVFIVDPAPFDREISFDLSVSSVALEGPNDTCRPSVIRIWGFEGATQVMSEEFVDVLDNGDGDEWDTFESNNTKGNGKTIILPAGADTVMIELFSEDIAGSGNLCDGGLPASMVWITCALTVPGIPDEEAACRMTGGATILYGDSVSHGSGQAGAPTAQQPQPWGEWTHHQLAGPDGSFVFHAGTASAPDGTEIDLISCSDPGWCSPARPAPAKQINFQGVGSFKNLRNESQNFADNVDVGESLHWFSVHIEDLGEPGGTSSDKNSDDCPEGGNEGDVALCGCPDFYRIRIHVNEDPNSGVLYEVYNYVRTGNYQIHPEVGSH